MINSLVDGPVFLDNYRKREDSQPRCVQIKKVEFVI